MPDSDAAPEPEAEAQADNNDGGCDNEGDAGGGGDAVPDAEAAPEPEAQAQAEAQLPEAHLPKAGDGSADKDCFAELEISTPACARLGCRYLRPTQNKFAGFWCGRCQDRTLLGHGSQCQKIPWRPHDLFDDYEPVYPPHHD